MINTYMVRTITQLMIATTKLMLPIMKLMQVVMVILLTLSTQRKVKKSNDKKIKELFKFQLQTS